MYVPGDVHVPKNTAAIDDIYKRIYSSAAIREFQKPQFFVMKYDKTRIRWEGGEYLESNRMDPDAFSGKPEEPLTNEYGELAP